MPEAWGWGYCIPAPPKCQQKSRWTWSYMNRGGCRFAPGHDGPCKPQGR